MRTAPVLVVCFSDRQAYVDRYREADKTSGPRAVDRDVTRWPIPYWHVDTGMAALLLMLAAHDEGLASCFFAVPAHSWPAVFDAFDVPSGLAPVGVVSIGHPAPDRRSASLRRGRKSVADVVAYGSFG